MAVLVIFFLILLTVVSLIFITNTRTVYHKFTCVLKCILDYIYFAVPYTAHEGHPTVSIMRDDMMIMMT